MLPKVETITQFWRRNTYNIAFSQAESGPGKLPPSVVHATACFIGCYSSAHVTGYSKRHCSRVWPPMRHNWLFVSVISWLLCVVAVIVILCRAFVDAKKHFRFCQDRLVVSCSFSGEIQKLLKLESQLHC